MTAASCCALAATIRGVDAIPVKVEVAVSNGIPSFSIVGMPDTAIQESRERVKAAIKASGFFFPASKIVVNLAPGSLRKHGSGFDLPIALAILAATGQIDARVLGRSVCVGELSLGGSVTSVAGMLPVQMCALKAGRQVLTGTLHECHLTVEGVRCFALGHLRDCVRLRAGERSIEVEGSSGVFEEGTLVVLGDAVGSLEAEADRPDAMVAGDRLRRPPLDFSQVRGHELAKRALQVAAVGMHDVLMVGPPGSGKTMLASCLPQVLPALDRAQALEAATIHSVAGVDAATILEGIRPFRAPHHSATLAGMLGGGVPVKPGEVSLAHNGVLFLDELPEFRPQVLQALRQPLEQGEVAITRADGVYRMPARFLLVAAANPCPCGYFGDPERACRCSPARVQAYQSRIGGPLLDRIDIRIDVLRPDPALLAERTPAVGSRQMRAQVEEARAFREERTREQERSAALPGAGGAGSLEEALVSCLLDASSERFFVTLMKKHRMSVRSGVKTLALARSIADLDACERVGQEQLAEACGMRFQSDLVM